MGKMIEMEKWRKEGNREGGRQEKEKKGKIINSIFLIFQVKKKLPLSLSKEKKLDCNIFYPDLLTHLHLNCAKINIRSFY